MKSKRTLIMWLHLLGNELPKFDGAKKEAYHTFFGRADDIFDFHFAFGRDAYKGEGVFMNLASYVKGEITWNEKEEVQADVIYLFNGVTKNQSFDPSPAKIINTPAFRELCADKNKQKIFLSEFFPITTTLHNLREIEDYLESKDVDELVVLKPISGSSGSGVIIDRKNQVDLSDIHTEALESEGYIAQQFIDTSKGIPGIIESTHDLRIITLGNTVVLCHVRTPQDGSLISNTHRGAAMTEVNFSDLPRNIYNFYQKIHKKITTEFGTVLYSMDIGVHSNGTPYLFELNGHTAFPRKDFEVFDTFINTLIDTLDNI